MPREGRWRARWPRAGLSRCSRDEFSLELVWFMEYPNSLSAWGVFLLRGDEQRRVRDSIVLRPVTRTMRCPVDAAALRVYVDTAGAEADVVPRHKDGTSYGARGHQTRNRPCAA